MLNGKNLSFFFSHSKWREFSFFFKFMSYRSLARMIKRLYHLWIEMKNVTWQQHGSGIIEIKLKRVMRDVLILLCYFFFQSNKSSSFFICTLFWNININSSCYTLWAIKRHNLRSIGNDIFFLFVSKKFQLKCSRMFMLQTRFVLTMHESYAKWDQKQILQ